MLGKTCGILIKGVALGELLFSIEFKSLCFKLYFYAISLDYECGVGRI